MSVENAIKFVHWGLPLLTISAIAVTLWLAPNPLWAVVWLFMWYVWGTAYNLGLDKVSILGFLPISICFASATAWAWLLSHSEFNLVGLVFVGYVFFTILFQISWSGHLKEMGIRERSNLLIRLGAKFRGGKFEPSNSIYYGWVVKIINLFLGGFLLYLVFSWGGLVSLLFFGSVALYFLHQLTKRRVYKRNRELRNMSAMEIATIFLPIAIVVPLAPALALMIFAVAYFWICNKVLWEVALYPRV